MPLAPQTPHQVATEVASRVPEPAMTAPLAYVHEFATQPIRRGFAAANDHERPDRDAVGPFGDWSTLPKAVSIALLDWHDRRAYPARRSPPTGASVTGIAGPIGLEQMPLLGCPADQEFELVGKKLCDSRNIVA